MEKTKIVLHKIAQTIIVVFAITLVVSLMGNFIQILESYDFYNKIVRHYSNLVLSVIWGVPMILAILIILIKNYDNSRISKEKNKNGLSIATNFAVLIIIAVFLIFIFLFFIMMMAGK